MSLGKVRGPGGGGVRSERSYGEERRVHEGQNVGMMECHCFLRLPKPLVKSIKLIKC